MASPRWVSVHHLLQWVAAESAYPITYGQVAMVLMFAQGKPCHRRFVGGMLRKVYEHCEELGEPDLTAFVIGTSGRPGDGWAGWSKGEDPAQVRKTAHEHYRIKVWGK